MRFVTPCPLGGKSALRTWEVEGQAELLPAISNSFTERQLLVSSSAALKLAISIFVLKKPELGGATPIKNSQDHHLPTTKTPSSFSLERAIVFEGAPLPSVRIGRHPVIVQRTQVLRNVNMSLGFTRTVNRSKKNAVPVWES